MNPSSVSVLGRPASGKTTFLAALYYSLKQNVNSGLSLAELPGDVTYLNSILENWEQFKPVERTALSIHATVSLKLCESGGATTILNYPDLSGEEFDEQWKSRTTDKSVANVLGEAGGIILFVGPKISEPRTIQEVFGTLTPAEIAEAQPSQAVFDPLNAPDDVVLVDLLQVTRTLCPGSAPRLAIVFSAWDSIDKTYAAYGETKTLPRTWCANQLPLLDQFLRSDAHGFEVRFFGVSAQGGDLQADRDALLRTNIHSERVFVVEEDGSRHNDIRAPIAWLIGSAT